MTPVASKHAGRNLDRAIIVILVSGISYFAIDKFVLAPDRAVEREAEVAEQAQSEAIVGFYGDRSIAVIPFENLSSDPEQRYLGDGVANLQIELLNALPGIRHVDPEVLSLTAQAYQLHQARPEGVGGNMYALLSRALEIDPGHIPALVLMTAAYWYLVGEEEPGMTWEEPHRKTEAIYDRVLEIDPNSAFPDYYYAFMLSGENKLEEAAALYIRGLDKDLTLADDIRLAGYFARHIGKLDAAVRLLKYALAIDPLCHQCRRRYAESLMYAGDYANAQWEFERYLAVANEGWDRYLLLLLLQGKANEALAYIDSADGREEWDDVALRANRAMALFSLGRVEEAGELFAELGRSDFHDQRALTLFLTEIAATGFQYLQRKTFSPVWQNLHDDPRWAEYLEFNGMSPERLDAVEFDPDLPE